MNVTGLWSVHHFLKICNGSDNKCAEFPIEMLICYKGLSGPKLCTDEKTFKTYCGFCLMFDMPLWPCCHVVDGLVFGLGTNATFLNSSLGTYNKYPYLSIWMHPNEYTDDLLPRYCEVSFTLQANLLLAPCAYEQCTLRRKTLWIQYK